MVTVGTDDKKARSVAGDFNIGIPRESDLANTILFSLMIWYTYQNALVVFADGKTIKS